MPTVPGPQDYSTPVASSSHKRRSSSPPLLRTISPDPGSSRLDGPPSLRLPVSPISRRPRVRPPLPAAIRSDPALQMSQISLLRLGQSPQAPPTRRHRSSPPPHLTDHTDARTRRDVNSRASNASSSRRHVRGASSTSSSSSKALGPKALRHAPAPMSSSEAPALESSSKAFGSTSSAKISTSSSPLRLFAPGSWSRAAAKTLVSSSPAKSSAPESLSRASAAKFSSKAITPTSPTAPALSSSANPSTSFRVPSSTSVKKAPRSGTSSSAHMSSSKAPVSASTGTHACGSSSRSHARESSSNSRFSGTSSRARVINSLSGPPPPQQQIYQTAHDARSSTGSLIDYGYDDGYKYPSPKPHPGYQPLNRLRGSGPAADPFMRYDDEHPYTSDADRDSMSDWVTDLQYVPPHADLQLVLASGKAMPNKLRKRRPSAARN